VSKGSSVLAVVACLALPAVPSHAATAVALPDDRPSAPVGPGPVVAVVGDLCDDLQECSRTAALVAALDPARLILAGDNAYSTGSLAEYLAWYDPHYGPFKERTHPVPGNHEYATPGASGYFDYFNGPGAFDGPAGPRDRGFYGLDLGAWHVVVLNSNAPRHEGSKQEVWLRDDLAASTRPCTMAVFHHPRFNVGLHGPDVSVKPLFQALQDFRADLIVNGHDHNYQRWAPMTASGVRDGVHGIRQFVVGTGGRALYPIAGSPDVQSASADTWGVLKLRLAADAYHWQFLPVAGGTFTDSGTATCKEKLALTRGR
jgi:hypothetical protein